MATTLIVRCEFPLISASGTEVAVATKRWSIDVDLARWAGTGASLDIPFAVTVC